MLNLQKEIKPKCLKICSYTNGILTREYTLDKKRMLLGRVPSADISIDSRHISNYHAFITLDENGGGKVIDLDSANGLFINGEKKSNCFFSIGDTLRFGDIEFHVAEHAIATDVQDDDAKAVVKIEETGKHYIPELVPIDKLAIIDGEYCDIEFDEKENFVAQNTMELLDKSFDFSDYVDTSAPIEYIPILKEHKQHAIEVSILSNGNIISLDYFPVKNRTYYISSDTANDSTVLLDCLNIHGRTPFITIKKDSIKLFKIHGLTAKNLITGEADPFAGNEVLQCRPDDVISYGNKTVQVVVRVVGSPPTLKVAPFFGRDRTFKLHMTLYVSLIMALGMLLLFVDVKNYETPPEKQVAVIYKEAEKPKEQQIPMNTQPSEELQKVVEQPQPIERPAPKPKEKPAPPSKAPEVVAEAKEKPMKAYSFKMNKSLSSLFNSKNVAKVDVNPTAKKMLNNNFSTTDINLNNNNLIDSKNKAKIGKMGDDYVGRYDKSSGTKGIASKNGFDTAYVEPKTVVLGSMDPELLRKILTEYLPQFRHCYNQELMEHTEEVQGTVDLNFTIGKDGRVTRLELGSKGMKFSSRGKDCMAGVLKAIDFPRPKGGGVVDVRQPLNFSSERSNN